jgi:hypothetical protein
MDKKEQIRQNYSSCLQDFRNKLVSLNFVDEVSILDNFPKDPFSPKNTSLGQILKELSDALIDSAKNFIISELQSVSDLVQYVDEFNDLCDEKSEQDQTLQAVDDTCCDLIGRYHQYSLPEAAEKFEEVENVISQILYLYQKFQQATKNIRNEMNQIRRQQSTENLISGNIFVPMLTENTNTKYDYKDFYDDLMKLEDLKNVDDREIFDRIEKFEDQSISYNDFLIKFNLLKQYVDEIGYESLLNYLKNIEDKLPLN